MDSKINLIFSDNRCFESDRLIIKPTNENDFDIFIDLYLNKKVTEFIVVPKKQNKNDLKKHFDRLIIASRDNKYGFVWTIYSKVDGIKKIGRISLGPINRQSSICDIGFTLLPNYWKMGLMSESIEFIISYLFNEINIHKICASCSSDNQSSKKLLQRLNFKREGILEKQMYFPTTNKYSDEEHYGLLNPKE